MKIKQLFVVAAAVIGAMLSPAAHALIFTFSFTPDYSDGIVRDNFAPVTGFIENATDGDNFNFDLTATITSAADPNVLGGGYTLLYLHGPSPAFTISAGKVTFADAIFTRSSSGYDETLTLYSGSPFTGIFRTNYTDFSGQFTSGSPEFGEVTAPVPEPPMWTMMIAGLGAIGVLLRRRVRQIVVTGSLN